MNLPWNGPSVVQLFALVASIGPFVLRVVQPRVEDDGGRAYDDSGRGPSSTPIPGPCPPSLQFHPFDPRSTPLELWGNLRSLLSPSAAAFTQGRCRSFLVEETAATKPRDFSADPTPVEETVEPLVEDKIVRTDFIEDCPYGQFPL